MPCRPPRVETQSVDHRQPERSWEKYLSRALRLDSIDPDRIAAEFGQGFTLEANLRASRAALQQIRERLEARQNFVIETTLAGRQPLRLM